MRSTISKPWQTQTPEGITSVPSLQKILILLNNCIFYVKQILINLFTYTFNMFKLTDFFKFTVPFYIY